MPSADNGMFQTYADSFWGGDLSSCAGYEALVKRNSECKKMCQELEDYLKKRSRIEAEYSKSLHNLSKCIKHKDEIGVLDKAFNKFRSEIETVAQCHSRVSTVFQQQADNVKKFKEDQIIQRKALEDQLHKTQNSKLSQLSKTIQLEKSYMQKSNERDLAEQAYKDICSKQVPAKEIEKAKNKAAKCEEEAGKSDSAYKSAVKVLESSRASWEREMTSTCETIQELDEKRLNFLRQEMWVTVNLNSTLALDIDNSCESIREILENCDIASDIQAFIKVARTGSDHPEPFVFKHYTKMSALGGAESVYNPYCTVEDIDIEPTTSDIAKSSPVHPKLLKKKNTLPSFLTNS